MEKADWKLNIRKTKSMASSPITSWQIDGEKVEAGTDFIFLGSKITVVTTAMKLKNACSLEGMMLKLKLQCFGHLMQRVDSLEKTLMLGGLEGRRRRG